MNNVISIREHQQQVWDAFVSAQALAQSSGDIKDGIAAGKAWRRWLDLFMTKEQREILDRKIA